MHSQVTVPRLAVASILVAASVSFACSRQPPTQPASNGNEPTLAATQPMVKRIDTDPDAFHRELSEKAPAEAKGERQEFAALWTIRKTMQDGTPQARQEVLARLKGVIVSYALNEKDELGMGMVYLTGLIWCAGDEGAPLLLDMIAGAEPGVPEHVNRSMQELAFLVVAADAQARLSERHDFELPESVAGVRMIPEQRVTEGLARYPEQLIALLRRAAEGASRIPEAEIGREVSIEQLANTSGYKTFLTVATAGDALPALYEHLIALEKESSGLGADLAIATAAAVHSNRFAQDREAVQKLDRVVARNPRIALLAALYAEDLLAAAAERAMGSRELETQLSGLILAKELVEAQFPVPLNEGLGSKALAQRLKPTVAALADSSDERVRQAAAEASEAIDFTADFGE